MASRINIHRFKNSGELDVCQSLALFQGHLNRMIRRQYTLRDNQFLLISLNVLEVNPRLQR